MKVFPAVDSVTGQPPLEASREEWYTGHLMAMGEPAIHKLPGETYRFTWLRTFHPPISVRVGCHESHCTLIAKRLDGAGGYEPGQIDYQTQRSIEPPTLERIRELLAAIDFWRPQPTIQGVHLDGARWILEAHREGRYHLWDIHSPSGKPASRSYLQFCEYLLQLSEIPFEPENVY